MLDLKLYRAGILCISSWDKKAIHGLNMITFSAVIIIIIIIINVLFLQNYSTQQVA